MYENCGLSSLTPAQIMEQERYYRFAEVLVGKFVRNSAEFSNYSDSGPFQTPEFSSEFYFFDRKMCSHQF
jgi:hypothetical protein